jgi:replicative DNA helicase
VNKTLTEIIPFAKGSLYLFGAISGHGKSTLSANVTYSLTQEKKKVLVISNEEQQKDVLARVACLNLGLDFNMWRNMKMGGDRLKVDVEIDRIMPYVTVVDMSRSRTTDSAEGVIKILDDAIIHDYAAVIIDYFQNIRRSSENALAKPYDVLLLIRDYLNGYVVRAPFPVILLAQLHPLSKAKGNTTFEERIKGCKAIYEAASTAIEILREKQESGPDESSFLVAKDRFGHEGWEIPCKFFRGRYLEKPINELTPQSDVPAPKSEANVVKS